jgi:hypothetical protein
MTSSENAKISSGGFGMRRHSKAHDRQMQFVSTRSHTGAIGGYQAKHCPPATPKLRISQRAKDALAPQECPIIFERNRPGRVLRR